MRRAAHGFTMLELLVAVAMLATLAGISVPFFFSTMASYRFNGAVWRIASDIRYVQSLAVANSRIYGWHWGGDGGAPGPNQSRVEKWPGAACASWPAVSATGSTNINVITNWYDLAAKDYPGVSILSVTDNGGATVGTLAFNARGASQPPSPCATVAYPVTITVRSPDGRTRTITVRSTGGVSVQ